MGYDTWREEVMDLRRQKDDAFAKSPDSPIPYPERGSFRGLRYYDPDPRYLLQVPLTREEPKRLRIPRSAGDVVLYDRVGHFDVMLPDGTVRLAALASEGQEPGTLFVPFRDATSGKETYGAGRYLEAHHLEGDLWLLDFNLAYHPFCAYNDAYACPLPPVENWLKVPVRAGERLP